MSKKCMVFETLGSITEMKKQKCDESNEIRLSGVFGVCGIKNNNRRTYSKENYGQMVECLQKEIMEAGVLGELEHPDSMNINLNNVSHKIESVEMLEDGTVRGTILLLNTDKGKNAKAIVEAGVPLYISSRALGNIDGAGNVTLTSLKTYDLVGTPGFSQAKLEALKESNQTFECLNESCYAIILEEDDLLGKDDEKKDKKEDSKDEKKDDAKDDKKDDSTKDDKKDDTKEEININVEDEASSEDKKNKKENKDNNKDMEDLTAKVQQLIDKVDSLEASLHVAKESLEAKTKEVETLKETLSPNYEAIERWVREEFSVQFKEEFKAELISQVSEGTEKFVNELVKENNEQIEKWIKSEFAPVVEKWTTQEFAPMIESWVTTEFAPVVENWTTEEFAGIVEKWVTTEFAPVVENWTTEQFASVVENWVVNQFGAKVDEWMTSEVKPSILESVNENVSEFMDAKLEEIQESKFNNIDAMLRAIEESGSAASQKMVVENNDVKYSTFYAIANMPNEYRPLWEMLSESRKNEIAIMSRAYDYSKNGVLESFWANVDFVKKPEVNVVESVITEPQKSFANSIASQMNKLRKY